MPLQDTDAPPSGWNQREPIASRPRQTGAPSKRAYRRVIRLTRSVQPHEPQRSRILYPRHYQGRQDLPPERLG
ncbi:protein of unknown function [Cupriavidus taiwanensis]|uniref:Uncharacterized protein n=1 Tax=Cupriavidus taiwanensis TaxID=164546 RepID=A0A7Z7JBT4_9BURK|nr:protein of unknown function [Cupriavidus taiwanensis]SOZ03122.1 hypothetical protein CBM2597_A110186 [Cupriavidus taiwanensis]SOZ06395.1 hypothetical protein CBM2595_A81080 [Cupriavidus taiwanensis]SPC18927.1 hypothetical protein CBM2594_A80366 [Cupriavidus taiwanensis]SPD41396.1 protein of unknown function [Cupriavidus taiwanensis]